MPRTNQASARDRGRCRDQGTGRDRAKRRMSALVRASAHVSGRASDPGSADGRDLAIDTVGKVAGARKGRARGIVGAGARADAGEKGADSSIAPRRKRYGQSVLTMNSCVQIRSEQMSEKGQIA